jgi:hypothetical protein
MLSYRVKTSSDVQDEELRGVKTEPDLVFDTVGEMKNICRLVQAGHRQLLEATIFEFEADNSCLPRWDSCPMTSEPSLIALGNLGPGLEVVGGRGSTDWLA